MRILVIAGMIDEKLHSKLAPLQANGNIDRIYLLRRRRFPGEKIINCIPPRFCLRWLPAAELWRVAGLVYLCLAIRPRLIIAFGTIPHGIYAWLAGGIFRIPVIQHVMGKNDLRLSFPGQFGRRLALRAVKSGALVAVRGAAMKAWLVQRGMAEGRIFMPQNIHDFSLFSPGPDEDIRHDLIYVGLLSPYKRLDLLLEAFSLLVRDRPGSTLLLVGDGAQRHNLESRVHAGGLAGSVTFAGRQEHDSLPGYLRRARVFIMTSQGEGLPMAMIEALSCGLPVIVPEDADIGEVARNNTNAITISGQDPRVYADAALRLLTDADLYQRLQAGALRLRQEYARNYSLEYQAELWADAISGVVRE